jgi:hypothetical protein
MRAEELIVEFAKQMQVKLPELSLQQISAVCKAPFRLVASEMKVGSLRTVRIKYLGCFTVYPGRVKGMLKKTRLLHEKGTVPDSQLQDIENMAENYFGRSMAAINDDYEEGLLD